MHNAGVGGSNTQQRLPRFAEEVLAHRPDLVTLEFVNDMGFPEDQLTARYAEILAQVEAASAALVLITPHFTMPPMMGFTSLKQPESRPTVGFLRNFAARHGLPLADASRRWEHLAAEGLPYLLRDYTPVGAYDSIEAFRAGAPWGEAPGSQTPSLPSPMLVVRFPE